MSAELLRLAAAQIREDFEREDVDDLKAAEFHLAVADMLDHRANKYESDVGILRGLYGNATESKVAAINRHTIAVARAYLTDPS